LQLRVVRCKMAPVSTGDGSAFFEMGNTKVRPHESGLRKSGQSLPFIQSLLTLCVWFQVLAVVYGPREPVQRSQVLPSHAASTTLRAVRLTGSFGSLTLSSLPNRLAVQSRLCGCFP
jgi:ribonuclease PH